MRGYGRRTFTRLPMFEESESPRMPYNRFSGEGSHTYL